MRDDPNTDAILLVSKPPSARVAKDVVGLAGGTPLVAALVGGLRDGDADRTEPFSEQGHALLEDAELPGEVRRELDREAEARRQLEQLGTAEATADLRAFAECQAKRKIIAHFKRIAARRTNGSLVWSSAVGDRESSLKLGRMLGCSCG